MNIKFIKKNLFIIILLAVVVFVPILSFATDVNDDNTDTPSTTIENPISVNNVNSFIKTILIGVLKIGMPIVALAIIYCGFLFVQARGKPKEIETAKRALVYTLIGAALLLGAWAIAQLISDTVLAL
ncbi:MAG: TrbC/VirB2 family protein [Candidatus Paceibacterota bacterium]|jgi:hypothetical protein